MHRLEKIVFEEEGNPDPDFDSYAVGGEVVEILKDQRRFKIPMSMADGFTPEMRDAVERQLLSRDSKAFPRTGRAQVVDSSGGTMGLHRPGFRVLAGGNEGDRLVRDGAMWDVENAYAAAEYRLTRAWMGREAKHRDDEDDDDVARLAAIRKALIARGADPAEADDYIADIEDPDLCADLDTHIKAFEGDNGRQTDAARRLELERLYQQREAELRDAWRGRK
jgi:hypothetical protein